MIIQLVFIILIVLLFFNSIIYSGTYKCPGNAVKINYVRASRLPGTVGYRNASPGTGLARRIGIDTINLKLDRDVPCGIYSIMTMYGAGVMFVGRNNYRVGSMNIKDMSLIANVNMFDLWGLERMENKDNNFIATYNAGCC
jgi:hypothetical protein